MVAMEPFRVDERYALLRRAAPFAELSRGIFENVLDMLAGRYVSDDFADLRPRITWDRLAGTLKPREGARRVAVIKAATMQLSVGLPSMKTMMFMVPVISWTSISSPLDSPCEQPAVAATLTEKSLLFFETKL
jgi:hypothetical protein